MNFNEYIVETFRTVFSSSPLIKIDSDGVFIATANENLVTIKHNEILLANKIDLLSKIHAIDIKTNISDTEAVRSFLKDLESKFIRLNHVGISYYCKDFQEEIRKYMQDLKDTGLKIYEEQAESNSEKWLFIGNTSTWEAPLCEIVLNSSMSGIYKDWLPAFQVDIDTTFTMEELETLSQKHFGNNFWKWKLDVPDYGVVLAMAILGEIDGKKITFGVGTNLRDTKQHRNSMKSE